MLFFFMHWSLVSSILNSNINKKALCVRVLFRRSVQEEKRERLRVRFRSKAQSKNRRRGKDRQGTDGTVASTYVLCHHIYTCPNLPGGQCFTKELQRRVKD